MGGDRLGGKNEVGEVGELKKRVYPEMGSRGLVEVAHEMPRVASSEWCAVFPCWFLALFLLLYGSWPEHLALLDLNFFFFWYA